jgi:hypothetical protein
MLGPPCGCWAVGGGACTARKQGFGVRPAVLCVAGHWSGGRLSGIVVSFGYPVLRQVLQLIVLGLRGERANEVKILVLRHHVAVLRRQVQRLDLEPSERVVLSALSRLLPRSRWATFLVTPGHPAALAPHP